MKPEEVDRVLSEEADIVPSSGFVATVMGAVTAEATAPPLTFPGSGHFRSSQRSRPCCCGLRSCKPGRRSPHLDLASTRGSR